ncbi:HAD family hydrolase [Kribbella qitaiheensis]|uniref:HAD family hydrolase n=1 Tax=Kribbella qitaiheensis TaxID=1544730 RepID=A0A7G6WS10_9ACTN|nr:HAD hydrolase-like protein [Kribbella qitaiheensis]QNE16775.1 HAD family hydrolase [Kribbella qitaiheensis]
MTNVRASHIVWDWNGTLLNDNTVVLAAVNDVCAHFGRAALTWEEWQGFYSRPVRPCYERVLARVLTDEDWVSVDRLYHDRYDLLLHTSALAPGVPDELHSWMATGRTQSLLSMWFHSQLLPTVDGHGLTELFQRIDGLPGELGGESKTEHLVRHLEAQSLDPAGVLVIGDVVDDAEAALAVGAQCILVATGGMNRAALEATGVPVTSTIPEAVRLIA